MRMPLKAVAFAFAVSTIASGADAESACASMDAAQGPVPADGVALLQSQVSRLRRGSGKDAEPINIVYASDSGYIRPLFNSMMSAALSADDPGRYIFHILVPPSDLSNFTQVIRVFSEELSGHRTDGKVGPVIKLHELQELPFNTDATRQSRLSGKDSAFARLFLDRYLTVENRAIWVDPDTIVQSDLSHLYNLDLERCAVAAVPHPNIFFFHYYYEFTASLPPKRLPRTIVPMLNDGVLLVDLEAWRRDKLSETFVQLGTQIADSGAEKSLSDQLMVNVVFQNVLQDSDQCFKQLEWGYNAFALGQQRTPLSEEQYASAHILHWSGDCKPWKDDPQCPMHDGPSRQYKGLYFDFANLTSFFDGI